MTVELVATTLVRIGWVLIFSGISLAVPGYLVLAAKELL